MKQTLAISVLPALLSAVGGMGAIDLDLLLYSIALRTFMLSPFRVHHLELRKLKTSLLLKRAIVSYV